MLALVFAFASCDKDNDYDWLGNVGVMPPDSGDDGGNTPDDGNNGSPVLPDSGDGEEDDPTDEIPDFDDIFGEDGIQTPIIPIG